MSNFWIEISDGTGTRYGEIRSAEYWESDDPLDRDGKFRFPMPASDPKAALVQEKRIATCKTVVNRVINEIGSGIIDKITIRPGEKSTIDVEGNSRLRELTYRQVGSLIIDDGSGGPNTNGPSDLIALAPSGWSLDTVDGYSVTAKSILHQFEGETILGAFIRLTELTGEHFRAGDGQKVIWMQNDQPDSGVRAFKGGDQLAIEENPAACLITDVQKVSDSYEQITRIYPYGAGDGDARVTLLASTWSAPSGWTIDTANNYIKKDSAESGGLQIERYLSWKDISDPDTLAEAAYEWLLRHVDPFDSYQLSVAGLKTTLEPGSTIRVVYQEWIGSFHVIDIDAVLLILQATNRIDANGLRTVSLQVSTIDRWAETDATAIVNGLSQAQNSYTHAQPVSGTSGTTAHTHTSDQITEDERTITGSEVLTNGDRVIWVDASGGAVTLTLPAASNKIRLSICKIDGSANAVTINAAGGEAIEGGSSISLPSAYSKAELIGDGGTTWMRFI